MTGRYLDPENPECGPDGLWTEGALGPISWETHFVEGNAWHYLWYVPYDIERMVDVQHGAIWTRGLRGMRPTGSRSSPKTVTSCPMTTTGTATSP